MSLDELMKSSLSTFELFEQHQETLEDAIKKSQKESASSIPYLRMVEDGTYTIRILPLAPIIDADGNATLPRKGYEYPTKEYTLKIDSGNVDKKGLPMYRYLTVCNVRYAFPELKNDLLDLYVKIIGEKYSDNEALCKLVKTNSFSGGLKYDSKRYMYIYNMKDGVKTMNIFGISYSSYTELENVKVDAWNARVKKGISQNCPISSIKDAQTVDVVRSTVAKKVSYSIRLTPYADAEPLTEKDLQELLDAPRIPDVIYKYTRKHLEATIIFLNQMDEKFDVDVMKDPSIQDCIDQIKMKLPADDQSHFDMPTSSNSTSTSSITFDSLVEKYEAMSAAGKSDHSDEGVELKTMIREYIEDKKLDVSVSRRTSIATLLDEIELAEGGSATQPSYQEEENEAPAFDESEDDEPETESDYTERNDDTNEPATRPRRPGASRIRR